MVALRSTCTLGKSLIKVLILTGADSVNYMKSHWYAMICKGKPKCQFLMCEALNYYSSVQY